MDAVGGSEMLPARSLRWDACRDLLPRVRALKQYPYKMSTSVYVSTARMARQARAPPNYR